jgi:branched-chain amino acid transport system ATP-binding protein
VTEAPALELQDVTVRFGGRVALDGVSVNAAAGCVTGIIGPNGAGKTTLFNVVCGLQRAERGTVLLGGVDITRVRTHVRARMGLSRTFQRLELFGALSAAANVSVAAGLRGHRDPEGQAMALLERVGAAHVASTRADELPTGQARLVELARALATGPQVLLLDEPASGQDDAETEAFRDVLLTVAAEGMAVVLVEHDVHLVMRTCARVHVLDFGRVLAAGTAAEVQADQAVLDAYLGAAPAAAP